MEQQLPILSEEIDKEYVHKHKHTHKYEKEDKMEHIVTQAPSNDAALIAALTANRGQGNDGGFGFGGMGMGGLLVGALLGGGLNGGGLFGNRNAVGNVEGVVTPTMLSSALDGVMANTNNTAIQNKLGTIEAAIPYNESQVQLALAQSTATITAQNQANSLAIANGVASTNQAVNNAIATSLASQNQLKDTIVSTGAANLAATNQVGNQVQQNAFILAQAITNDGERTRALITSQYEANLQRELTVAQNALTEQRNAARVREVEVNVTNNATATAQQTQAQYQQQQQLQLLVQQNALLSNLANDIQVVRQGQTIFNSGTMAASGTQTAANTRVN